MERKVLVSFVFILMIGLACAADEWGDISGGNDSGVAEVDSGRDVSPSQNESADVTANQSSAGVDSSQAGASRVSGDSEEYTQDFYFALGLGGVVVLILLIFFFFFLRKPKNRWK